MKRNNILEIVFAFALMGLMFLGSDNMTAHGQTPLLLLNGTNLTTVPFGDPTKPWKK